LAAVPLPPAPDPRPPLPTPSSSVRSRIARVSEDSPLLLQFVLLSMLLHMLVVLMFGTATVGGARRGDGWLGPLDVTLRPLSPERGAGFTLAPGAEAQPPGAALLRRMEGATTAPVAAKQVPSAVPVTPPETSSAAPSPAPSPPPAEVRDAVPDVSLTPRSMPADALPRLDRTAPEEVDKPLVAPTLTPQKAPSPIEPRSRELPVAPRAPPVELKPREEEAPVLAPIETPAPAKVETPAAAKVEREPVLPVEAKPRDVALPQAVPIERIPPVPIERTLPAPVELPAPRKAPVDMVAPARALPTPAPAPARESAPRLQSEVKTEVRTEVRTDVQPAVPPAPRAAPADVAPAGVPDKAPAARPETPAGAERIRFGAPSAEEEIFGTRRDAPAADAGTPPAVTVESMKRRAREIAAEGSGSRGVLNMVPPPPVAKKDKLAEDIAKAAKPDCRTAYAGLGILAVVPLVASSVGNNGGCNW